MIDVNILCDSTASHRSRGILNNGLSRFKSRAIIFPILRYDKEIKRRGINCRIHTSFSDNLTECNILIIQDNSIKEENKNDVTLDDLHRFKESVDTLVWLDTTDSTGTIHTEALSIVDSYLKKQLFDNRHRYLEPMYGLRPYTHYYNEKFGIKDEQEAEPPIQVASKADLGKLEIAWHIGLVPNFPYTDPAWYTLDSLPEMICKKLPWDTIFSMPLLWKSPSSQRSTDISGRFSTRYERNTVQFHRKRLVEMLKGRFNAETVSPKDYWTELRRTKILLSPFGCGEICHRDFEGFISGNILIKPSVEHIDTWPPLFQSGTTYVDISWDMKDAVSTVDTILKNYEEYRTIAEEGQERYYSYIAGPAAARRFADHFENILKNM